MLLAAVFMLVVIFLPKGIAGLFDAREMRDRFRRHRNRELPADLAPLRERPSEGFHG